jgi:hypothetical protein
MSEPTPEPHSDPPDEPTYCNNPDCDQCREPTHKCPGTDPV